MTTDQSGHSKGFAFVEFENEASYLASNFVLETDCFLV